MSKKKPRSLARREWSCPYQDAMVWVVPPHQKEAVTEALAAMPPGYACYTTQFELGTLGDFEVQEVCVVDVVFSKLGPEEQRKNLWEKICRLLRAYLDVHLETYTLSKKVRDTILLFNPQRLDTPLDQQGRITNQQSSHGYYRCSWYPSDLNPSLRQWLSENCVHRNALQLFQGSDRELCFACGSQFLHGQTTLHLETQFGGLTIICQDCVREMFIRCQRFEMAIPIPKGFGIYLSSEEELTPEDQEREIKGREKLVVMSKLFQDIKENPTIH